MGIKYSIMGQIEKDRTMCAKYYSNFNNNGCILKLIRKYVYFSHLQGDT